MNAQTRFYKNASVAARENGFGVMLDQYQLRTPKGSEFTAPTAALAELVAGEWNAQGELIGPDSMPVTRLCFASVDLAMMHGQQIVDHIVKYAETDLLCHRAETPSGLVARQREAWDPILAWAEEALQVRLPVVTGIIAADVAGPDIALLRTRANGLDDFRLTGLSQAVSLTGSALLGFALLEGRLDAEGAYAAAVLDDTWNQETWGTDMEAQARLARIHGELQALGKFFAAMNNAGAGFERRD